MIAMRQGFFFFLHYSASFPSVLIYIKITKSYLYFGIITSILSIVKILETE